MDIFAYVEDKIAKQEILLEEIANGYFNGSEINLPILTLPGQQYPLIFDGRFGLYVPIPLDEKKKKKNLVNRVSKMGIVEFECEKQFLDFIPLVISKRELRSVFEKNSVENSIYNYTKTPLFGKYLAKSKRYDLVLLANAVGVEPG